MLILKNIDKVYKTNDLTQTALKNVNINFRQNEFVSILGPSGSGKTTLLNIIGGLDKYTSGDLIIKGVSTKYYKDRNWNSYRNGFIGFVFQSYNLIPQSTVLKNVELALAISGISKKERKKRAIEVLEKVGLKDHIKKRPNQLSGGQMQRVAIARALVNNPEILLADEPTGALDSTTSVQIMELLKEIAKDKLVIMVTHNPQLAKTYSTRIIELLDGEVTSDTNPCLEEDLTNEEAFEVYDKKTKKAYNKASKKASKKVSMSFLTALLLSFQNLRQKKARTFLTSFAGSIGIIGIALILALSHGMNAYIAKVEAETLSNYPMSIQSDTIDFSSSKEFMEEMQNENTHTDDKIYQSGFVGTTLKARTVTTKNNNLYEFKKYIESPDGQNIKNNVSSIKYGYDLNLQVFSTKKTGEILKINPSPLQNNNNNSNMMAGAKSVWASMGVVTDTWIELINNQELLNSQYSVITGKMPEKEDEIVVIVNKNNELSDQAMYVLGLKDQDEFNEIKKKIENGETVNKQDYPAVSFTYDEILNISFKIIPNFELYQKTGNAYIDKSEDDDYLLEKYKNAFALKVVGIIKPSDNAASSEVTSSIGYTEALTKKIIETTNNSQIVKEQKENKDINVFTGAKFVDITELSDEEVINLLPDSTKATLAALSEAERAIYLKSIKESMNATADTNLTTLGAYDYDKPSSINLYLKDFNARETIVDEINKYNSKKGAINEDLKIEFTDFMGIMIKSINEVINMITYLLIGFVSISLVVSSIMIGIITYISVLERTKEIGILRSLGASKLNVSNVFIAETSIVGLIAGLFGILASILLTIPVNLIINNLAGVNNIAVLPTEGAIILVVLSVLLTVIAGIIPARLAAKKDPVTALRTE